jgi:hypothetical protein
LSTDSVDSAKRRPLLRQSLRPPPSQILLGLPAVALMIVWAVHDGGYDADTWYWGALATLGLLAVALIGLGTRRARLGSATLVAITLFGLYVAWSFLSIAWARYPGAALDGSNRALLYLLVFALLTVLPWTERTAELALTTFAIAVGAIAIGLLVRFASNDRLGSLLLDGRLTSPTGYFNATAALFTIDAVVGIGLAARRTLPGLIRGLLVALAAASLQLAVVVQSRGWLFTLPIIGLLVALIARDRLRLFLAALIPAGATLIPVRSLLRIYNSHGGRQLEHVATHAGRLALVICGGAFVVGTLFAWGDRLARVPPLTARRRLAAGSIVVVLALGAVGAGALKVSHGHPVSYVSRQWRGFSHPLTDPSSGSHFNDVGSGRYDFWRVSLDAFKQHPVGGLGQDNFADYYITRRHTQEEPQWNHSLELRLLSMTGIVGAILFGGFLIAAIAAALRSRRHAGDGTGQLATVALFPLVVWLVHGSVDWFWEMPALSAPALGFAGMAARLAAQPAAGSGAEEPTGARAGGPVGARRRPLIAARETWRLPRPAVWIAGSVTLLAALAVLGFSYLSVREVSLGNDVSTSNPARAFDDLKLASRLNPLSADPGRYAGAIALQAGDFYTARQRFSQAIAREPGGWFSWLGAGLAESALGDANTASHDFKRALAINSVQPAVKAAVARVRTHHPLTADEAFSMLVVVG